MEKRSSNIKKIILSLVLSVAISGVCYANSLSQLDITRSSSSDSSLDVTLYTSSAYSDNVAVTKKSDNKYVIIMPNVASSQTGKPDFHGVRDFVSDIDVKSVNDGNGGYTKVTLTTTKPVNIRTKLKNSTPLTPEQKAYKSLITKSRTNPDTPVYIPDSRTYMSKTKLATTNPAQPVKATTEAKPTQSKPVVENNKVTKNTTTTDKKIVKSATTETKVAPANKEVVKKVSENIKTTKNTTSVDNKSVENNLTKNKDTENKVRTEQNKANQIKNSEGTNKPKNNLPITLVTIILPILSLIFLLKMIRKSVVGSMSLKHSFNENLADKPVVANDYETIVSDKNLSWQEKYKQYRAKTNKDKDIDSKKDITKYTIEKKPAKQPVKKPAIAMNDAVAELEKQINKLEIEKDNKKMNKEETIVQVSDNKQNIEKLEKILHDSPKVEKIDINEEDLMTSLGAEEVKVYIEDNSISSNMSDIKKAPSQKKFKGFANKIALEETSRTKPLPKKHDEIKNNKNIESKHVELEGNKLYSSTRDFKDANLRVADLISKSRKFIPNAAPSNDLKLKNKVAKTVFGNDKGYGIATLDEFFALPESNRATASSELSNKVASSLSQIKPSIKLQQKVNSSEVSSLNPFKSGKEDNVLNGLIVKSGVNLDDKKGLYVVNLDGETALIGRIENEVFVLKKFSQNIENPIRVRHDDANVYMVKADKYRSLVQVDENKMDVLVEL